MSKPKSTKPTGRRGSDKAADITPEETESIDWSAYMFGGYNADLDKVSLYRTSPKEHLGVLGLRISGRVSMKTTSGRISGAVDSS
jgi:hypothetical protein